MPRSLVLVLLLASGSTLLSQSPSKSPQHDATPRVSLNAPLAFVPSEKSSQSGVDFSANGPSYAVGLTSGFAELALASRPEAQMQASTNSQPDFIRMTLVGAAKKSPVALSELTSKANIFQGKDSAKWRTDVPMYGRVLYRNVYPGVDVAYYGSQGSLEYDFVISPKSQASSIGLTFQGASAKLDQTGNLELTTPSGRTMRFEKPVIYQKNADGSRRLIAGDYTIAKNGTVGFNVEAYDTSRDLVIDPVLSYASFLGGNEYDQVTSSAVSPQGYLYVTGYTYYYDNSGAEIFPTTKNAFQAVCNWCLHGANTAFVSKFNADGTQLIYSTFLEGSYVSGQNSGGGAGYAIAASVDDEAYVFGVTFDADFPLVKPLQSLCRAQQSGPCAGSFFISRLNPAGNALLYSTFFGNNSGGYPTSIGLDQQKDIVLSGAAYAPGGTVDLPITKNAYQATFTAGIAFPFVTEISASGQAVVYSTWLGGETYCDSGNGTCQAYPGQAVLSNGLIYVTGSTEAGDFPVTSNAYQGSCFLNTTGKPQCNEMNGYLAIFDPTGSTGPESAKTVTYIHGPTSGKDVYLQSLALDHSGNIFLTGDTQDAKWPVNYANGYTPGTANLVVKMNPAGSARLASAYLAGLDYNAENVPSYVTTDASGNVYTSFQNNNSTLPLVGSVQTTNNGKDLQIVEQSNDLSKILFSTYAGGSASIIPTGVSVDAARNIYVAGQTPYQGADFITTAGAYQTAFPGGEQKVIVEKLGELYPASAVSISVSPSTLYANTTVSITADVTASSGTPTGSVAFYGDGLFIETAALSGGSATIKVPAGGFGSGTHTAEAIYLGDATLGGSVASVTGTVHAVPTATALTVTPTTVPSGGNVTLVAKVTRTEGSGAATGTVNFLANGTLVASESLVGGVATLSTSTAGESAGSYSVTAQYVGDATDAGSKSAAVAVTLQ
jgi:hypothetical protein